MSRRDHCRLLARRYMRLVNHSVLDVVAVQVLMPMGCHMMLLMHLCHHLLVMRLHLLLLHLLLLLLLHLPHVITMSEHRRTTRSHLGLEVGVGVVVRCDVVVVVLRLHRGLIRHMLSMGL